MTAAHLVFAAGMTAYMLIAIQFEERDLLEFHGERYAAYRQRIPMLVPGLFKKKSRRLPTPEIATISTADEELVTAQS